ncbi:TPA: acyltransferase family protein [Escherichia coli]|nr:Acyltransferase family [Escherichia coli]CAD6124004.1 Acyltransferase family [Escherichia coli]
MIRNNCFDLIRLLAALMVIISHHAGMMGYKMSHPADWLPMDSFYVFIFISLSGYLVTNSFMNSDSYIHYLSKRIRRVFPALIFCCFVCTYILIPFWESSPYSYITSGDTFSGFLNMSIMHGLSIPNAENVYGRHTYANAPLWTLAYEFFLYIIVGMILCMSKTWKAPAITLALSLFVMCLPKDMTKDINTYGVQIYILAKFGIGFSVGSLMYITRSVWDSKELKLGMFVCCAVVLFALIGKNADMNVAGRVVVAIMTIIIGVSFKDRILNGRLDISYGMYIWAWPIQAIVVGQIKIPFWYSLLLTLTITILAATFSRKYIEEPFLSKRSKQSQREENPA